MLDVNLKAKGPVKRLPPNVQLAENATAEELAQSVAKATGLTRHRVRLSTKVEPDVTGLSPHQATRAKDYVLQPNDHLATFKTKGSDPFVVYVRDLGPQIAWRTVFLIEYVGPLIIHPLFYYGQRWVYGTAQPHTLVQQCVFAACIAHFVKRELETAFLHKFSLATMPLFNLFKNCAHYWLLSGVLLGYFVYAPDTWAATRPITFGNNLVGWHAPAVGALMTAWIGAEISNFVVHKNLASLRPTGTTERKIPYGYGFGRLSCPNYFFEAQSWLILSILSANWSVALFTIVSSVQMYFWAVKKHRRYLREFTDYPKNRKAMVPFVV